MNQQNEFYVWLASNASLDIFPGNKPQLFKNKLAETLNLAEETWEVGIADIFYPNNYHLHFSSDIHIKFMFQRPNAPAGVESCDIVGNNEKYRSLEELIQALNLIIREHVDSHKDSFRTSGGAVYFFLKFEIVKNSRLPMIITDFPKTNPIKISIENMQTKNFLDKIGFRQLKYKHTKDIRIETASDENKTTELKESIIASELPFRLSDYPAIFVYCDKVEYQFVGDTRAPLLGTMPVFSPEEKELIWQSYTRISYVPLKKDYINDIEISLKYDTGENLIFKEGKVFLKLHFQKQLRNSK